MTGGTHSRPDLRRRLEPYWRRRWLVLAILVLVPAAVYGASSLLAKTYEASTTLLVRATYVSSSVFGNAPTVTTGSPAETLALIETTPVARDAARKLGEPKADADELLGQVSASSSSPEGDATGSEVITVTAQDEDAGRAAAIANAFAAAIGELRAVDSESEIERTIARLEGQADLIEPGDQAAEEQLSTQVQELRGLLAAQEGSTQVIEPAGVPESPVSPKPRRNAALAFVLAVLLAAGAVPLADAFSRRLRNPDELGPLLGVSMLAQIPARAFRGQGPAQDASESCEALRASLTYFHVGRTLEVVLTTSPGHGEGRTTVATNLAVAMARAGRDVILLDADLRKPQAAQRLGVDPMPGLEQVLIEDLDLDGALRQLGVEGGSLWVLGGRGPARNPGILLGSQRMRELLGELRDRSDLVIVDTPPLLAVSDAIPLLRQTSGAILVSRINRTRTTALNKSREVIEAAGGNLLGSVATGAKAGGPYGYYGERVDEQQAAESTEKESARQHRRRERAERRRERRERKELKRAARRRRGRTAAGVKQESPRQIRARNRAEHRAEHKRERQAAKEHFKAEREWNKQRKKRAKAEERRRRKQEPAPEEAARELWFAEEAEEAAPAVEPGSEVETTEHEVGAETKEHDVWDELRTAELDAAGGPQERPGPARSSRRATGKPHLRMKSGVAPRAPVDQPSGLAKARSTPHDDAVERIRRLGELRKAGFITDEEFRSKKAELLDRL